MKIEVGKFGEILVSRPAGREAYLVARSYLRPATGDDTVELDFSGVKVMGPSWADEFIGPLQRDYGDKLVLLPCTNASVNESLRAIEHD